MREYMCKRHDLKSFYMKAKTDYKRKMIQKEVISSNL